MIQKPMCIQIKPHANRCVRFGHTRQLDTRRMCAFKRLVDWTHIFTHTRRERKRVKKKKVRKNRLSLELYFWGLVSSHPKHDRLHVNSYTNKKHRRV